MAAWFLYVKSKKDLLLMLTVNLITNPLAVCAYLSLSGCTALPSFVLQIPLECLVILTEGWIYTHYSTSLHRPWLFAVETNCFSYITGRLLQFLIITFS